MGIFTNMTELELVEAYIDELYKPHSKVYADEQALSDAFDLWIAEIDGFDLEDEIAVREAFSNWADTECKEGNLHSVQYSNYDYVGEHS